VRCVCDPVRCTPFASTPKSKLHRRHRPVISRDTRTYWPSRTPTKHRPQKSRRIRDTAFLTTPPCKTWRLGQTGISARIQCAGQLARPDGSTGPRPACTRERRRETRRERSGRGRKERECGGGGAWAGATTCVGLTAITRTDHNAVRKKAQIGTACAPTHVPRSVFRRPSVTAGPMERPQIQAPAIARQCNFLVAHLSRLCTLAHTVCTPPRGTRSGARF